MASIKAGQVAARIWQDQDMQDKEMDTDVLKQIAELLEPIINRRRRFWLKGQRIGVNGNSNEVVNSGGYVQMNIHEILPGDVDPDDARQMVVDHKKLKDRVASLIHEMRRAERENPDNVMIPTWRAHLEGQS